jgi:hypothetical protein
MKGYKMKKNELGLGASHEEDAAQPAEPVQIVKSATDFSKQPRYDIRIELQDGEPKDWKGGVNGTVFQIWRGVVVTVPECIVGVLRTAVASKLIQVPQADGPPLNVWQEASAVPYSIIRGPY